MNKPSPHPQVYWRELFFAVGKMTTFQSRSNSEGFASTHKCPHGTGPGLANFLLKNLFLWLFGYEKNKIKYKINSAETQMNGLVPILMPFEGVL